MVLLKIIKQIYKPKFWLFLWNYWLGATKMVRHDYEEAINHFNRCLSLGSSFDNSGLVYEHLGKCYFDINEIKKGKFYLLKVSELTKDKNNLNSEVTSRLGFIFFEEGELEKARFYLKHAKAHYRKIDYTNIKAVEEYLSKMEHSR